MDVQYLADEMTVAKAKSVRTLSIVAISLAGAYFLEGIFSVLFALIPIPFIGFLVSIVLSVVEFALLVAAAVFGILALVRSLALVKELTALPDNAEKTEALECAKLARILSIVGVCVTGFSFVLLSILNIFELILSFI